VDNLVLLTFDEAEAHEAGDLRELRQSQPEFVSKVERLLAVVRHDLGIRQPGDPL
jgi:hypothetical protein